MLNLDELHFRTGIEELLFIYFLRHIWMSTSQIKAKMSIMKKLAL